MEIKLYNDLETFEIHHLDDFNNQKEYSYLGYLDVLHKGYDKYLNFYLNESVKKITEVNVAFKNKVDAETIANTTLEVKEKLHSIFSNMLDILKFIQLEKERQKTTIKFKTSNNQSQSIEVEPLTTKQVQKIGLLIRSGIVDFIKEKNPKITTNQIAGFIDLVSKEPLKQTSINPHLSKTNSKYAILNQQDKDDLDLILNKFGISPQS